MPPDPPTRSALLARLPADGFLPPTAALPAGDPVAEFAAAVEHLAATFWDLPPAERRARWEGLRAQFDGPAAARLADLEPGLDVRPRPQRDRYAAELGRVICGLFTLPPAARAARRREWLMTEATPVGVWAVAAKGLAADRPTAALDPLLIHRLRAVHVPTPVPPADLLGDGDDPLDGTLWLAWRDAAGRRAARRRTTDRFIAAGLALLVLPFLVGVAMWLKTVPSAPRPGPQHAPPPTPPPAITAAQLEDLLRRSRSTSTAFRAFGVRTLDTSPTRPTRR